MSITPLPTPPNRDDPANFATRADAFLGALPAFATEANALQTDVTAKQGIASDAATTATTQAGIATTQAGIATTQAGIATTKAGEASASAAAALASQNAAALSETNAGDSEQAAASSAAQAEAAVAGLGFSDVVFINSTMSPYAVTQVTSGKLIACDTTGGAITITLPQVGPLTKPYVVGVKKTTSDANSVTVNCTGTDTFDDGTTSKAVNVPAGFTLLPDSDPSPDKWTAIGFGGATAGPVTGSGLTMTSGTMLGRNSSGGGAIEEIPQATQAEMEGGVLTALRAMTPLGIKQAVIALAPPTPTGKLYFFGQS